jgi:Flp pilus assembly protein TadB
VTRFPGRHARAMVRAGLATMLAGLAVLFAVRAGAVSASTSTPASQRSVIILLDINGSLAGPGIVEERQAALAYANALPPDVRAGLITFWGSWRLALGPTTDRARLATVVAATHLVGGRSVGIYDAITGARETLGRLGATAQSRLLVLSEGEDLVGRAFSPGVPTDVVTWHFDRDDFSAPLLALASASGGHATAPAHIAALAAAFGPVKTPTPAQTHASAGASAGSAQAGTSGSAASQRGLSRELMVVAAIVFLALFVVLVLLMGGIRSGDRRGRHLVKEFERYGPRHAPAGPSGPEPEAASGRSIVGWVSGVLKSLNKEERLAERLDLAGMSRKPAEWVLLGVLVCLVATIVLTVLMGNALFGVLLGTALGWLAMKLSVSYRIRKRRGTFSDQLPDVLQLLAGSLQAGFSLAQALDAVVREDTQPSATEFSRALSETRLGVDLTDALDTVANRMESSDLRWTVMAIRIQREVGGNLAEVLRNTVDTMRERAYLHRHVRALSAEGRLSAYVLIGLPILVGGWLFYSSPNYMRPLYTTIIGIGMLIFATLLLIVGSWWMSKVVKVEV